MPRALAWLITVSLVIALFYSPAAMASDEPDDFDVVVVGGGMGGLSAGAVLSNYGFRVLLLEQHHKVGGCTTSFSRGEFNFDAALHEMLGGAEGTTLGDHLADAGVADKIELIPIETFYRAVFPGVDFAMPTDPEAAVAALCERWPADCPGIQGYFEEMRLLSEQGAELRDMQRKHSLSKLLIPIQQPVVVRHLRSSLDDVLDRFVEDETLKAVLAQPWLYYGPPPDRLWSLFHMSATYGYHQQGAYHIKGSSQALADAYAERIMELGGQVRTGTRVDSITVESGRVRGVTTDDGEVISARYVVSNADPFQTFNKLIGSEHLPAGFTRRFQGMAPSNGLVGVYLGLDVEASTWGVEDHEIFYNTTIHEERSYQSMMDGSYDDASVTITFYTNLGDDFYAPPGKSVVVLNSYTDIQSWPTDRQAYQAEKERVAQRLISLAERMLPGLSSHIEVQEVATPRTVKSFTLAARGTPYGFDATPEQAMFLPNYTPIDGLYLAGAWTSPGHGVGTAQMSGREAALQVLERERTRGLIDRETLQALLDRVPVDRIREVVEHAEEFVGLSSAADVASDPTEGAVGLVIDATSAATSRYQPVVFDSHERHQAQYGVACNVCHHDIQGQAMAPRSCSDCHDLEGAIIDLTEASHRSCRGCHQQRLEFGQVEAPVACLECHRERP